MAVSSKSVTLPNFHYVKKVYLLPFVVILGRPSECASHDILALVWNKNKAYYWVLYNNTFRNCQNYKDINIYKKI